ncbi:hypothetical protein CBOM_07379 [Ceraceosorus bombacis]|uniref:Uncharacterized protein n=1 Tax=Ceraceosorus bombacis TaxID=401625 RepID=A0A0P1BA81_9BASI|nr:hypothetical protein CBOM_07379 [Ceraceosorus bombacis]
MGFDSNGAHRTLPQNSRIQPTRLQCYDCCARWPVQVWVESVLAQTHFDHSHRVDNQIRGKYKWQGEDVRSRVQRA